MNDGAHQIEPEFLKSPPRAVKKRGGGIGETLLSLGLLIAMMAVGAVAAKLAYFTARAKYRGVTVPVKIVGRHLSHGGVARVTIYIAVTSGAGASTRPMPTCAAKTTKNCATQRCCKPDCGRRARIATAI